MLVVLALLAIAVVIALVGVGNTMALSVVERRRESALLRALGLTSRQLRGMLAIEAALIAAVAASLGIGLGVLYAWAGIEAIDTQAIKLPMTLNLPWGDLCSIFGVAVIAGLLASVIPGFRAARLSPVGPSPATEQPARSACARPGTDTREDVRRQRDNAKSWVTAPTSPRSFPAPVTLTHDERTD